ncbi:Hachiman antiphage defense system protein HamA [Paraburkholderia sp. PGU19]|uniref:Hachiman antiphage defense system protein HamA n=1 Tax=Paraburkholderia sp. PGU19 TaxID=2735434 RepID=UPI0015D9D28F|nr:Hachiman antiphage defense system protein HamA [Paraburkholderia sp. PGU19]
MPPPEHLNWLVQREPLRTDEGKTVTILEFQHQPDNAVLSAWARHFRQHYCSDDDIDVLRAGTEHSRSEFLKNLVFPNTTKPGPSIRSGDFAEILVCDFLEHSMNHWVPRGRFAEKATPNESVKGTDIIGLYLSPTGNSIEDTLTTFEVKAQLRAGKPQPRLQVAVDDAAKDKVRQAYTLLAMKRKAHMQGDNARVALVERFQAKPDRPFIELTGAAAVLSNGAFDAELIAATTTASHPPGSSVLLLVIRGEDLMTLAHSLYERAADEA